MEKTVVALFQLIKKEIHHLVDTGTVETDDMFIKEWTEQLSASKPTKK